GCIEAITMVEEPPKKIIADYGIDPALAEVDKFKTEIVEELRKAKVPFPIKTREQLMTVFPKGVYMQCTMKGQKIELHEHISKMRTSDFPIQNAGDVADKLASFCTM
ncbi:MAG: MTH865 family protein, partial [Halobacteriota archaeon]